MTRKTFIGSEKAISLHKNILVVCQKSKVEDWCNHFKDNYDIDLTKKYKLANHVQKNQSKLVEKFKGSLLGSDIGVKSSGFTNVAILATVIAIAAIAIMYFMWRF